VVSDVDTLTIATWNVNSVRARMESLVEWLRHQSPDVALLQETKIHHEAVDKEIFEDLGYNVAFFGQKAWNGVAILSKRPLEDVRYGFERKESPAETRSIDQPYLHARVIEGLCPFATGMMRVVSIYAPIGNPLGSDKYQNKLLFMDEMYDYVLSLLGEEGHFVLGGDYNVLLEDKDAADRDVFDDDAVGSYASMASMRRIMHLGVVDSVRARHRGEGHYSYWDYQDGAWEKDHGILIDRLLLSPHSADCLRESGIMREMRGRGARGVSQNKPSDHVPVWCRLSSP